MPLLGSRRHFPSDPSLADAADRALAEIQREIDALDAEVE